jgi:ankyrin repeat protein
MVGKTPKRRARPGVDGLGRTPLHYAAADGRLDEVARLLAAGADANAQDDNGWSPLHFAAQSASAAIVEALLGAGAELDPRDSFGNTPLFKAVFSSKGDGAVIKLLRDAGADPHAANSSGVSPLSLARTIANYDVAQFFSDLPPPAKA